MTQNRGPSIRILRDIDSLLIGIYSKAWLFILVTVPFYPLLRVETWHSNPVCGLSFSIAGFLFLYFFWGGGLSGKDSHMDHDHPLPERDNFDGEN